MSHFSRIRTQMVERAFLVHALEDLGMAFEEGVQHVRTYGGQRTEVELKAATRVPGFAVGFRRTAPSATAPRVYEMVADWWGVRGLTQDGLTRQLTQRYAYHAARTKLAEQGFELMSEQQQAGGDIHLVLRRAI